MTIISCSRNIFLLVCDPKATLTSKLKQAQAPSLALSNISPISIRTSGHKEIRVRAVKGRRSAKANHVMGLPTLRET